MLVNNGTKKGLSAMKEKGRTTQAVETTPHIN
jgi:hypothetical protein